MAKKNVYSIYHAMDGHDGYYQNPTSKRIKYSKTHYVKVGDEQASVPVVIFTRKTKITDAKKVVDEELIKRFSSNPKKDSLKAKGIKNPLLSTIWEELIEERSDTRHENTIEGYGVSWRISIEPFWGKKTLAEVDEENMKKYAKWYLSNFPTRVFFNTHKHLSMLLKYIKDKGYLSRVPEVPYLDDIIEARTQKEKVGRVYTDEEFRACVDNAHNLIIYTALFVYRFMGLRKMELLKAKREHWDLKNRKAKVWSYKNKKWRFITIPEIVAVRLERFIKESPKSDWLFPAQNNSKTHMRSQVFDKHWTLTKIAAGIEDATVENAARVHDWRHTFATQTARDGWPPIVACYVLDMSLKEYQETYTHVRPEDIMALMAKSFGGLKWAA